VFVGKEMALCKTNPLHHGIIGILALHSSMTIAFILGMICAYLIRWSAGAGRDQSINHFYYFTQKAEIFIGMNVPYFQSAV
jgi:hypothetical protein